MATHAKKAIPGKKKGGARAGAGRPPGKGTNGYVGAIKALNLLDSSKEIRAALDADPARKELVMAARKTLIEVMLKPKRWSSQRITAALAVIDELCGKLAAPVKLDGKLDQTVVVEIVENKKPTGAPAPTTEEKA